MCKSFDVSMIVGIYSYAIAAYLYKRNIRFDRGFAIILFVFSTIQWLEAALWYDIRNLYTNSIITKLIPIVLGLEFMASLYAVSLYTSISLLEWCIYSVCFVSVVIQSYKSMGDITTVDLNSGSLLWGGTNIDILPRIVFLILLLAPLRYINFIHASKIIIPVIATFIYSFQFSQTFGSNWCLTSNVIALLQLY